MYGINQLGELFARYQNKKAKKLCVQIHLCLDAGYIDPNSQQTVCKPSMVPHIRPHHKEIQGKNPRRWVVKRRFS